MNVEGRASRKIPTQSLYFGMRWNISDNAVLPVDHGFALGQILNWRYLRAWISNLRRSQPQHLVAINDVVREDIHTYTLEQEASFPVHLVVQAQSPGSSSFFVCFGDLGFAGGTETRSTILTLPVAST